MSYIPNHAVKRAKPTSSETRRSRGPVAMLVKIATARAIVALGAVAVAVSKLLDRGKAGQDVPEHPTPPGEVLS